MEPRKVLLIDDEEELVATLVERLLWRGIEAEAVTSGQAALARMREGGFDVVVADIKMPGLGGREVMEIIRRDYPQVKVLLITGHGRGEQEELVEGIGEVLLKPFKIDTLIEKIRQARQE
jgi:two-component system OmpR family response regulator